MEFLKNLIKKYFATFVYFYRYLKHRLFIVIVLSIAVGTLDAFGLAMFLPILQIADGGGAATGNGLGNLAFLVNGLNAMGITLTLVVALIILLFFFILKGVATYFTESYKVNVLQYFTSLLRLRLTNLFTRFSFKSFVSSDVGRIQNSFTSETTKITSAFRAYSNGIQQLVMTFIYMIFVFLIDWRFALLVCIGGMLTNGIYSAIFKKTKEESIRLSDRNSDYHKSIIQYITNFKYLKATGLLNNYSRKLQDDIKKIESTNKSIGILNAQVTGLREPLLIVVVCIVIVIQVYAFDGKLATILMSLLLFYRALTQLLNFQTSYNTFLGNSGSLDNIAAFEEELKDASEKDGKVKFKEFKEIISLENACFNYDNTAILKNINLQIHKNKSIAFIGESGSGKTTLVNLISGLLPLDNGSFKIDGTPIEEFEKQTYQQKIGYIAQEPVVFNDTVYNNVTFWAEPTPENLERFQKAIDQASIGEFINTLPEKDQTLLGNNGINLSGGQKQRISIARELYKDIDILILDEATSALDSETEKDIQMNIEELKGKYTILIIAHRLSTVKSADVVYLIDKGEIIGSGNFEELMQRSEKFRKMVELQGI